MSNLNTGNVYTVDSTGAILVKGVGCRVLWIMHYAALDDGTIEILQDAGGLSHFKYVNNDVSALGNYRFFPLGGQTLDGLYIGTLTSNNKAWIGVA